MPIDQIRYAVGPMRALATCALLVAIGTAHAERLPVRVFTTADGLANNQVERGAQDTHGFLWFATAEGVSRFDGRRFESFGVADGLPAADANDIAAGADGRVWVATVGGLAVLDLHERVVRPRFRALTKDVTYCVIVDPDGVVWAGTQRGLQRIAERDIVTNAPVLPASATLGGVISVAYDTRDRSLWLGTFAGLVHRSERGELARYRFAPRGENDDRVFSVLVAKDGTVWIGHVGRRVLAVKPPLAPTASLWESPEGLHLETDGFARRHLLEDSTGTIWIGTSQHLYRWRDGALERLSATQIGVAGPGPSLEDHAGNLWFGSNTDGVVRLARDGLVSYDVTDGLASLLVYDFVHDGDQLYPVALDDNGHNVHRREGNRYVAVHPPRPAGCGGWGWGSKHTVVLARDRRWWWTTGDGIARYPAVARIDDLATTPGEKLVAPTGVDLLRVYEDRRGDVWFSTGTPTGVSRWDRASDTIVAMRDGWPTSFALSYAEDAAGSVWIGFSRGELVRVRDGVAEKRDAFVDRGAVEALLFDRAGRLWIASSANGVVRLDDPLHPVPRRYTAAELGSDQATSLIDDMQGRVYVGTSHGIARIDPASGEIVRYGVGDGLRNEHVIDAARDSDGAVWFGTRGGMARLVPQPTRVTPPPPAYIMRLSIAGTPQPLAPAGEQRIGSLELAYDAASIDIEVASPLFALGGVRFQYRLDGDWSAPLDEHVLHFARLAPGEYALDVRTVDAQGAVSPSSTIAFTVKAPMWRRWWFISAVTMAITIAIALLAYLWHRRRLAHMLALERVRRRIATDLHDELGSSLSRIAVLSEVAARKNQDASGQLEAIGTSARELVDVASDIVWSTDPRRDDLQSLIVRLRTFAADVFEARDIAWSVTAPNDTHRIKLDPDRRRHLYLVLKEAITNVVKHSGATRVDVSIRAENGRFVATVRDNGCGFDETTLSGTGNGLANMRARAEEAGGVLEIHSNGGTEVVLRI
jgi:signal transduction histidine kinase/ligand-binding sensor domain-containing protein